MSWIDWGQAWESLQRVILIVGAYELGRGLIASAIEQPFRRDAKAPGVLLGLGRGKAPDAVFVLAVGGL